jgi:hypothetical protein
VVAVFAFHPDKAFEQVAGIQIPVDDLLEIGSEKSILGLLFSGWSCPAPLLDLAGEELEKVRATLNRRGFSV